MRLRGNRVVTMARAKTPRMTGPRILLIVGGGIAAYKSCELVRLVRKGGVEVTCVLTEGGSKFVTALALAALSENTVHTSLWDLKNEVEMGHIQLSREADLVVVCPATANLLAKMAAGIADDLATTLLLATDKPVLAVPAMNVKMWQHAATVQNVALLRAAGVEVMDPDEGPMACGEFGAGRLPEPVAVWRRIAALLGIDPGEAELPAPATVTGDAAGEEAEQRGRGGPRRAVGRADRAQRESRGAAAGRGSAGRGIPARSGIHGRAGRRGSAATAARHERTGAGEERQGEIGAADRSRRDQPSRHARQERSARTFCRGNAGRKAGGGHTAGRTACRSAGRPARFR